MRKLLGLLALAGLLAIAAPAHRADAAVTTPGIASALQSAPENLGKESLATEVRWRRRVWVRRYYAPRRFYAPRRYYAPRYYGRRYYHRRYW